MKYLISILLLLVVTINVFAFSDVKVANIDNQNNCGKSCVEVCVGLKNKKDFSFHFKTKMPLNYMYLFSNQSLSSSQSNNRFENKHKFDSRFNDIDIDYNKILMNQNLNIKVVTDK